MEAKAVWKGSMSFEGSAPGAGFPCQWARQWRYRAGMMMGSAPMELITGWPGRLHRDGCDLDS